MIPQVNIAFMNWMTTVQLRVVKTTAVDFEPSVETLDVQQVAMMLNAMSPRKVDRKPENLRRWKWWEGWSQDRVAPDTVLQDPDGLQYRVNSVTDWSQAGFYEYELVEQPDEL